MTRDFIWHMEDVLDIYEQSIDDFLIRTQNYENAFSDFSFDMGSEGC